MQVLIVHPCARTDPRGYSPWSAELGACVSALKSGGHEPSVLRTSVYDEEEMRSAFDDCKPGLVLIYTLSRQADQARAMGAFFALNYENVPVFFVGPHPSAWPADCLNVAKGVYVLRGYCDHLLSPLADTIAEKGDFFNLPGLSFPVLNRFYHNPIESPPELSERPLPDRELTGYTDAMEGLEESVGIELETSRGEYNICDCSQAWFDMSAPQTGIVPPFQQYSAAQVIEEAKRLLQDNPEIKFVGFRDENCLANPAWVKEFCNAWPALVGVPFWVSSRPEFLKESVFEMLAEAGCFRVHLMMESGSEFVRRKVLGRRLSDTHLLYAARAVRRFGMMLITVNQIGYPGETEAMFEQTIEMNRKMRPDWAMLTIFHPEPGSAVYQRADAKKWLSKSSYGIFYDPDVKIQQPWIRSKKVAEYLEKFNDRVFGPPKLPKRRKKKAFR